METVFSEKLRDTPFEKTKQFHRTVDDLNKTSFNRNNKNRPKEVSSKAPLKKKKIIPQINQPRQQIDPRFESAYGEFKQEAFERRYQFINKLKKKERKFLSKHLTNQELIEEDRKNIKLHLRKHENRLNEIRKKQKNEQLRKEKREYEISQLKKGKKPFYQKKSVEELLRLTEQFEDLKNNGKLNKHIKRRFKKNEAKGRKTSVFH